MTITTETAFGKLLAFLDRLERDKVWYRVEHNRDSLMVLLATPGERWEVDFFEDGRVEVERFVSPGWMEDEGALNRLLAELEAG